MDDCRKNNQVGNDKRQKELYKTKLIYRTRQMKRVYEKPSTTIIFMEIEGNLLMDSAHGTSHEGFTEGTDLSPHVEDGTDDDSPF